MADRQPGLQYGMVTEVSSPDLSDVFRDEHPKQRRRVSDIRTEHRDACRIPGRREPAGTDRSQNSRDLVDRRRPIAAEFRLPRRQRPNFSRRRGFRQEYCCVGAISPASRAG